MAPVETPPQIANERALAAWPNVLAVSYVLFLFVALRAVSDDDGRAVMLGLSGLLLLGAIAGHARGYASANADGKKLLLSVVAPADALLLVGGALCAWFSLRDGVSDLVVGAGVLAVVAGAAVTSTLEIVAGPMRATGAVDNRRVQSAARAAGTIVAAITALVGVCYGVQKLDIRRDFSFAAPTSPSAATVSMLEAAQCPAEGGVAAGKPEVFLFFERGSTALSEVQNYFDVMSDHGARITTQDAAFDPATAKEMKVSKNGTVGFRCGKRTESWTLGDTREDAAKKLGKLDEEVRTKLAKISKDAVTVYVTYGHGERSTEDQAKDGAPPSAKLLKKIVEALNAKTKKLGVAEGLTQEVPKDAALVLVIGPTSPFLPEEVTALTNYVAGGGALMLLVDPKLPREDAADVTASLEPLLATLGVRVGTHEVMNDKAYVKNTGTNADWAFVYSTSFGSHKSVKTLSGARGKANLLFMNATDVKKRDDTGKKSEGPKIALIARTPADSWVDVNDDRKYDKESEARAVVDLAAAIELEPAGGKDAKSAGAKEGRAWVVGDADVVADLLVPQPANKVFAVEGLLWLLRDDDKLGDGVAADEDVPIKHTRDEDTLWFYLTILVGPALCIGGGAVFISMKRRRRTAPRRSVSGPPAATTTSTGGAQ